MVKNYLGIERSTDDLRKIPEETADMITTLATMPEYQHGTGCKCAENMECEEGQPIYRKIAKELKIDHITVHCQLDHKFRKHKNKSARRYQRSKKGKARKCRYEQSKNGKARVRRYLESEKGKTKARLQSQKYIHSKEGKAKRRAYEDSEKGKAARARALQKYFESQKGKEKRFKWNFISESSLMIGDLNPKRLSKCKNKWIKYFNELFDARIDIERHRN